MYSLHMMTYMTDLLTNKYTIIYMMYSLHMMTYMTDLLINKHTYTVHVHKMSPYSNSNYLTSTVSIVQ